MTDDALNVKLSKIVLRDELELSVGDEVSDVRLLLTEAPQCCALITKALPLAGRLTHAKQLDNEVIFMLPLIADVSENSAIPSAGYLFLWRFTLCIWFGPTNSAPLSNCFARITSNLDGLARVGKTVWAHQGVPVTLGWKSGSSSSSDVSVVR